MAKARIFTHFWDMHSGGSAKEPWEHILIEANEAEARVIFYNRFGHNPDRVTCTCCGSDYSVYELKYSEIKPFLKKYGKGDKFLIIAKDEIKPSERSGEVSMQGYIWV